MNAPQKLDPIQNFMPWENEEAKDMRRRLRLCRDLAAKRATYTTCDGARSLFWTANYAASEHIYASVPFDRLKDVRNTCLYLVMAANSFERWEAGQ